MNENGDLYHYLQKKYIEIKIAVFITDQGKMSSFEMHCRFNIGHPAKCILYVYCIYFKHA
jgi:hypothetical protein